MPRWMRAAFPPLSFPPDPPPPTRFNLQTSVIMLIGKSKKAEVRGGGRGVEDANASRCVSRVLSAE